MSFNVRLPRRWPLGVLLASGLSLLLSRLVGRAWDGALLGATVSAVASFCTMALLSRHDEKLLTRMKAEEQMLQVQINGICFGRMTDAEYAAMERRAFGDGRLAFAQVTNVGGVLLSFVGKVLVTAPVLMFGLAVLALLTSPEEVAEVLQAWSVADAAAQVSSLRSLVNGLLGVSVVIVSFSLYTGSDFGFRNKYEEAVGRMVRLRFGVPVEGHIDLSPVEQDR